ncbi:hypothetical protein MNEG_11199 [Monoraphidium neglectum]|uniref:H/ACA ribonucleoprotein complex subunit n=1 Tax=Monoraphidium neglectum TaxID=145388 RepID=A0A0D2MQ38_9CHLO|nr:hypothetical protein MNEG_11199 [Monoraphidium neglectum]KIY96765.1 hypothetical protein MNEG_11199 [Monoraphidium neglectum]|eukprot:XP_013895785.1 hypothetical protein MNEG_11199 [Monoraphidium neglectum]
MLTQQAAAPEEAYGDASGFELPSVDDLEVAAAAAAAAMEAFAGESSSSSDDEDSSSGDSSSSEEDEDMEDVEGDGPRQDGQQQQEPAVRVLLQASPDGGGGIRLSISVAPSAAVAAAAAGPEVEEDSSPLPSSSDDSSSDSSSDAGDDGAADAEGPLDYEKMRGMIDAAYAVIDEEDDEAGGGGGGGGPRALHESLGLREGAPSLEGVRVEASDPLVHVGNVTAVVEDMAVVQGLINMPALAEGSVLLLEDRCPVGRVEEVFGPVTQPLYAFRYEAQQLKPAPQGGAAGPDGGVRR